MNQETLLKNIRCANADLIGARQAYDQLDIDIHDWDAHDLSITETEDCIEYLTNHKIYNEDEVDTCIVVYHCLSDEIDLIDANGVTDYGDNRQLAITLGLRINIAYDQLTDQGYTNEAPFDIEIVPAVVNVLAEDRVLKSVSDETLKALIANEMDAPE